MGAAPVGGERHPNRLRTECQRKKLRFCDEGDVGTRSQKPEVRSQKSEVRSQKSEARSRNQKPETRNQNEIRRVEIRIGGAHGERAALCEARKILVQRILHRSQAYSDVSRKEPDMRKPKL